jgi:hypothetical protein
VKEKKTKKWVDRQRRKMHKITRNEKNKIRENIQEGAKKR